MHPDFPLPDTSWPTLAPYWAAAKEGHLLEAFKDDAKSAALAQANNVSVGDLKDMCWNAGDEKTVNGVAAALKKTLQP